MDPLIDPLISTSLDSTRPRDVYAKTRGSSLLPATD